MSFLGKAKQAGESQRWINTPAGVFIGISTPQKNDKFSVHTPHLTGRRYHSGC